MRMYNLISMPRLADVKTMVLRISLPGVPPKTAPRLKFFLVLHRVPSVKPRPKPALLA